MMSLVAGAMLAACGGLVGGRLLLAGVDRLVDADPGVSRPSRGRAAWLTPGLGAVVMLVLWWWEVVSGGLAPQGLAEQPVDLALRCVGHGCLLLLLVAATWIDFRHRVIPDAITVPGVLAGLAWTTVWPRGLLPVSLEIPRSFAEPLRRPDVLGLAGPLQGPWPGWLASAPVLSGLAAATLVFAAWWCVGTAPAVVAGDGRRPWWTRLATTRSLVAAVGMTIVASGWLAGGDHWRGLVSSLGGLAVAAGIIWLTRAGASLALGREAMGLGDVTLMAMVGAWLGWQPSVLVCFLAVFIGLAHGVAQLVLHSEAELPFGPSLCLAAAAVVVGWRPFWEWTAGFFEHPLDMAAVVVAVIVLTGATLWAWQRLRGFSGPGR